MNIRHKKVGNNNSIKVEQVDNNSNNRTRKTYSPIIHTPTAPLPLYSCMYYKSTHNQSYFLTTTHHNS